MIVELLPIALETLGENMSEPIVGVILLVVVGVAMGAVALLFFLRHH